MISKEGPPFVELMEFTGQGTHAAARGEGFHHAGFTQTPDLEGRLAELAGQGVGHDGRSLDADGRLRLWFTDRRDLDGIRLETVSFGRGDAQPIFTDGGEPVVFDAEGRILERS